MAGDIASGLEKLHDETHDKRSDPELSSEAWLGWRIATNMFDTYGKEHGFDYDTCNEIAALPFLDAFETAYRYLTQAGLDADEALADFIEKPAT